MPQKYSKDEFYFAQETIDFIKYCKQNHNENSFAVLSVGDIKVRSLHSFDIFMPIIYIASEFLLPIGIGLVTNYICEKMKGREKEKANVNITFIVKSVEEEKKLHYNGDAKTFKETFEKIDINKM